jgi:hypothetical protein
LVAVDADGFNLALQLSQVERVTRTLMERRFLNGDEVIEIVGA